MIKFVLGTQILAKNFPIILKRKETSLEEPRTKHRYIHHCISGSAVDIDGIP